MTVAAGKHKEYHTSINLRGTLLQEASEWSQACSRPYHDYGCIRVFRQPEGGMPHKDWNGGPNSSTLQEVGCDTLMQPTGPHFLVHDCTGDVHVTWMLLR